MSEEQKERVPVTPALKQKIQTIVAIKDKLNDWEKDFTETLEKILENPSWTLTPKRVEIIKKLIAKYVTKTEGNNDSEMHEGDFTAMRTNSGWEIQRKKSPIGVMTSRTEAEYIIAWLAQSWGSISVEVVNGEDGEGLPGTQEVDEPAEAEAEEVYEDEDGNPCDAEGNLLAPPVDDISPDDDDDLPF